MTETPASLLDRLCHQPKVGDWKRLIQLLTPVLLRWARRLGIPLADTEDALQDVFVLLVRKLSQYQRNPQSSFRAWLWTVFRNELLARQKRLGRQHTATEVELELIISPDALCEAEEQEFRKQLVGQALQLVRRDFPDKTWKVFWRLAVDGVSGVRVAREFGITPNAVYLARSRVMARLRLELAGFNC